MLNHGLVRTSAGVNFGLISFKKSFILAHMLEFRPDFLTLLSIPNRMLMEDIFSLVKTLSLENFPLEVRCLKIPAFCCLG